MFVPSKDKDDGEGKGDEDDGFLVSFVSPEDGGKSGK